MKSPKQKPAGIASDENAKKFKGISVLYCGPERSLRTEHSHPEAQLSVHLPVAPASHRSGARIWLHPPHQPHRGVGSSSVEVMVFHFAPDFLQDFSETMSRSKAELIAKRTFHDPVVAGLAVLCKNERNSPDPLSSLYVESASHMLLRHMIRWYSSASTEYEASGGLSARELSRLTSFIEENLHVGFTVTELAAWMGTSPNQLARKLRSSTGLSIWRFVQRHRVAMAKILLMNRALSIAEIGTQLGYCDQSHFTKAFRGWVGLTPGEFSRVK